jgi:hypothetical protein
VADAVAEGGDGAAGLVSLGTEPLKHFDAKIVGSAIEVAIRIFGLLIGDEADEPLVDM